MGKSGDTCTSVMITNTAVQVPLSDGASPTGEMTKSVKNPKKDRKTKKSKGKIQSKIVSPPSPTYVSSVFKPDPPDVNKSTLKIDPSRLADTRGHLFGVCNDESQDAERLMKAAEKRAQLRDTHEELFGHSTPDESPRAQKPARENTMKNLFGEAEPISVRTRRRWEDDSHKTLFGADPRTEKQIARPLRSENTKENLFPVGESGAIDATYPWRRRPKRRQLLREDTQTSLFGMTTGSEDCAVPLVRRASSPSTARSHELMFNNAPQQQQQLDAHTPSVGLRAPTTHEKLFGMPLTPGGPDERVDELRTPKFLPVQLHRVESPKTFEHVFPSRHTSDSLAPDEIRKNSNADCRFPIRLHRVESPKTYLYGQPDETANDQIQPKTTPERYTSKNPKAISDSIGQFFYLPGSPENLLNSKKRLRYVNKPQAIATENVRNPITGNGVELPEHRPAIERRKDAVVSPITGQVTARAEFVKPIVTRVSRRRVLQWGIRNRMMDDGGVYIGEPAMIERKHDSVVSPITGSGVSGGRDEEQLPFGTPLPITHCRRRPCLSSQNSPRVNTITGQIMSDGDIESRPNDDDDDSDGDEVEDDDDENAAAT